MIAILSSIKITPVMQKRLDSITDRQVSWYLSLPEGQRSSIVVNDKLELVDGALAYKAALSQGAIMSGVTCL